MPNTTWAEWVIARLSDRDRAAAIIGDLLESGGEQNPVWFWWSVAGVVLSHIWRSLVGFAVAFLFTSVVSRVWSLLVFCPPARGSWFFPKEYCPLSVPVHRPPQIWLPFLLLTDLLCTVAPYALVRYGFRDRFAQLTLALCLPGMVVMFCWWVPAVAFPCALLVVAIIGFSGRSVGGRGALLALSATLVIGYGGRRLAPCLAEWYLELTPPSVIRSVAAYDSVPVLTVAMLLVACNLMHRFLMHPSHH